jgi:hypothetical protein
MNMKIRLFMASLLVLAGAANALTINNEDSSAYTLKVTPKGGKTADLSIKANGAADVDCAKGCTLDLNGKTQNVDAKTAKIAIKAGKFVVM